MAYYSNVKALDGGEGRGVWFRFVFPLHRVKADKYADNTQDWVRLFFHENRSNILFEVLESVHSS